MVSLHCAGWLSRPTSGKSLVPKVRDNNNKVYDFGKQLIIYFKTMGGVYFKNYYFNVAIIIIIIHRLKYCTRRLMHILMVSRDEYRLR